MKILLLLFVVAATISTRLVRSQCDCGCGGRMPVPTATTSTPCQPTLTYNQPTYPPVQAQAPLTNMLPPNLLAHLYQSQPVYMTMSSPKTCAPKPQQAMPQMPQVNSYTGFHAPATASHPPICVQSVYVGKKEDDQEKDTCDNTSYSKRKSFSSKKKGRTNEDDQEDTEQPEQQDQRVYSRAASNRRRSNNSNGNNGRRVRNQRRQTLSPSLLRSLLAAQGANTCSCTDDPVDMTDSMDNYDCGCGCDNAPSIVYIRK